MNNMNIDTAINTYLGYKTAETPSNVEAGKIHIINLPTQYLITCVVTDKIYIEAMSPIVDKPIQIVVKGASKGVRRGKSKSAGHGFGDRVWRRNTQRKGIEISFAAKPSDDMRAVLKGNGYRWSHMSGVWYISEAKLTEGGREILKGLTEVESI